MDKDSGSERPELEQAIRHAIAARTRAPWQILQIELVENRVIIHGCVGSYYHKQLVLQGVLDVIGSSSASRIELDIQIVQGATEFET